MTWRKLMRFITLPQHRATLGLLLFIVLGFVGNVCRWTLFFNIDFIFGSVAVWLVVCLYGLRWGTLAGLIAGSCTYLIWHHPYTTITFTAEAWVVGWLFHQRRYHNIVLLDALFWLLLGMPLVWLFYAIVLRVDPTQAQIILLKQPINGIFNALIASLLLTHVPIHRWVARPAAINTLSLQQTLFNLLLAFVMLPTLILIVLASQQVVDDIKTEAHLDLADASRYLTVEVSFWYNRRLTAVRELANLAALALDNPALLQPSTALQQSAQFAQLTFSDFRHIHVLNRDGQQVLDLENQNGLDDGAINDRWYLEQLQRSPQPFLSPVQLASDQQQSPYVILALPISHQGNVIGAVLCEIDLSGASQLLRSNLVQQQLRITLLDPQRTVAASTENARLGQRQWQWHDNGDVAVIGDQTYHWLPTQGSQVAMVRWNNSFFVRETQISRELPWTLVIELAATPRVQQIERVHTQNMAILLGISAIALVFAVQVSRRLVTPLAQLTAATTNLPDKLVRHEPIYWPNSSVTEFALLAKNFRLMAHSLQQKFGEIQKANATLDRRVHERTEALQTMNATLAIEILERQQVEAALRESEERFRLLAENTNDLVCLHQPNGYYLYVSPSCEPLLGYSYDELVGRDPYDFFHPEDHDAIRQRAHLSALVGKTVPITYRFRQKSGDYIWLETLTQSILDSEGQVIQLQTTSRDVTERVQAQDQLRHDALHDALTGLPNRNLLMERLELALLRSQQSPDFMFAVLFLDLDRFKIINDSLGHLTGDQLLIAIAAKLQTCVRDTDLTARLGGDEFVILLDEIHHIQEAVEVAERIAAELRSPFKLDQRDVFVTTSIGIVSGTTAHHQASDLLRDADIAMYQAKANGKSRYELFDPIMHLQALRRLHLENDLRHALEAEEFVLHYQPIVKLETGAITGFEVLIRWQHPQRGMIAPTEFIPVAEETGLIVPIGFWVLHNACQQMAQWQAQFAAAQTLKISVNLSAKQLQDPGFIDHVQEILTSTGLSGDRLTLELTESMLIDDAEHVIELLRDVRSHAIQISIDDFGTGYSSLNYLHRFPINTLKIDKSFISRIGAHGENSTIAETVITLANGLSLDVIAEGIETEIHLSQLKRLGCDMGQGYLFARPLTTEAVAAWFSSPATPLTAHE